LSEKLQNVMAVTDFLALLWQEKQRPEHGSDFPGDGHGKEIDVCRLRLSAHACRARRWRRSYEFFGVTSGSPSRITRPSSETVKELTASLKVSIRRRYRRICSVSLY
jgi:hypothetical protein